MLEIFSPEFRSLGPQCDPANHAVMQALLYHEVIFYQSRGSAYWFHKLPEFLV